MPEEKVNKEVCFALNFPLLFFEWHKEGFRDDGGGNLIRILMSNFK